MYSIITQIRVYNWIFKDDYCMKESLIFDFVLLNYDFFIIRSVSEIGIRAELLIFLSKPYEDLCFNYQNVLMLVFFYYLRLCLTVFFKFLRVSRDELSYFCILVGISRKDVRYLKNLNDVCLRMMFIHFNF